MKICQWKTQIIWLKEYFEITVVLRLPFTIRFSIAPCDIEGFQEVLSCSIHLTKVLEY